MQIENSLRKALKNENFLVYYQPIVNLKTQEVEAFEALIRWQHPEEGVLGPDRFISIAEEIGLILPMGEWVLSTACQQLMSWQQQFPERPLTVSVNLSVQQLENSLLLKLEELLNQYSLKRNTLMLEITESMLVQNVDVTRELLNRFRDKGVGIVIDDFGTGYSCLRYLHQLPINALKIDRGFISPPEPEVRSEIIAESIISLCQSLGLRAIAEGIETLDQMNWLKQVGCDTGQGFYFAKPMTAAEATKLLGKS